MRTALLLLSLMVPAPAEGEVTMILRVTDSGQVERMVDERRLDPSPTTTLVDFAEVDGEPALAVTTRSQFADVFIVLHEPIDFTTAGYLSFRCWVPADAWIGQVKFNFQDVEGNTGGFRRGFNHFDAGNLGRWIDVTLDLEALRGEGFTNWYGEDSPLPAVTKLSINPFNADLLAPTTFYINDIRVHDEPPAGYDFAGNVQPVEADEGRTVFDFEDDEHLRRTVNRRAWEASGMAFVDNVAGRVGRTVRCQRPVSRLNSYLFNFRHIAGAPLDGHGRTVSFRYYIDPTTPEIVGGMVFLANAGWETMLIDPTIFTDLKVGQWAEYSFVLDDMQWARHRGESDVMSAIDEIRFDFEYAEGAEGVSTIYLDEIRWE